MTLYLIHLTAERGATWRSDAGVVRVASAEDARAIGRSWAEAKGLDHTWSVRIEVRAVEAA
jgi:hypothetical protein